MADAKAFRDFLTRLSTEPSARSSFQDDPVEAMRAAGLSDSQIIAVLSQDPARVQSELGDATLAVRIHAWVIVTVVE